MPATDRPEHGTAKQGTHEPETCERGGPQRMSTESIRFKALVRASLLAIGADTGLIVLLYGLSRLTGSTVLLADTFHSVGDLGVTATVLLSILVNHRYLSKSWGRFAESLLCLGVAGVMGVGAVELLTYVVQNPPDRFIQARDPNQVIAFVGISCALVVTFVMAGYKKRIGRRYDSPLFEAEGAHTHSDFLTSFGVWVTLLVGYFGLDIERAMTALIGLAILNMTVRLLIRTVGQLRVRWPASLAKTGRAMQQSLARGFERLPLRLQRVVRAIVLPRWPVELGRSLRASGRRLNERIARIRPPFFLQDAWIRRHAPLVLVALVVLILGLYGGLGFYSVQPWEEGVEIGLGRAVAVHGPGLHLHAPPPFGTVEIIGTGLLSRLELGFRTDLNAEDDSLSANLWEAMHTQGRFRTRPEEALTLTGDENLVDSRVVCYYRIIDPVRFGLQARDPVEILRAAFAHEVHAVQRHIPLDGLLTSDRQRLQDTLLPRLRRRAAELDIGVAIHQVYSLEAHPPLPVVPQYRAVVSAKETKSEVIHRAHEYSNELVPRSRGQAVALVKAAEADSITRVVAALGGADRFRLQQHAFGIDENVHRIRLHWDAIEEVLAGKRITILPAATQRRIVLSSLEENLDYE